MSIKLTEKQKKFIQGIKSGMSQTDAAKFAGYAESTARITGSKLMKNPLIKGALSCLDSEIKEQGEIKVDKAVVKAVERLDPLEYLQSVIDDETNDTKTRMSAASTILPYTHHKLGEKGKKEHQQDAADKLYSGKFGSLPVPKRKFVN